MIGLCGHRAYAANEECHRCVSPHPRLRVVALPDWPAPLLAHEGKDYCAVCGQSSGHWAACPAGAA